MGLKDEHWYTYRSFSSAWKNGFWTVLFLHAFCKSLHTVEVVFPTFNAISRFLYKSACAAGRMLAVALTLLLLICIVTENREVRWNLLCRELIFTDRVRSTREGYVLTRVCPSIVLSVHTWGRGGSSQGGGVPQPGQGMPRYASCVHAGQLSCLTKIWLWPKLGPLGESTFSEISFHFRGFFWWYTSGNNA